MKTKQLITLLAIINLLFCTQQSLAQNISMNGTGAIADPSAILDISSPTLGLLVPRVALVAINNPAPITSPTLSLLVFNTATASTGTNAVSAGYYYWDGAKWVRFAYNASGSSSTAWDLLGNAGTNPTTNFIGTTDAQDLVLRTNNLEAVRINTVGFIGVGGSPLANAFLRVVSQATASSANPILRLEKTGTPGFMLFTAGALNGDYSGMTDTGDKTIIFSNDGNGAADANSGLVIAPHTTTLNPTGSIKGLKIMENGNVGIGTPAPNARLYLKDNLPNASVDLVLENSAPSGQQWVLESVSTYTNVTNGSLVIGNRTTSLNHLAITPSGNLGIGTTTPTEKLEVQGSVKIVDGTQGAGKVLTSDASGKATWQISSGSLISTQSLPIQSIPPTATTLLSGFSFAAPSASDYRVEFRCWNTFVGASSPADVAQHVRLLKNGVPVDEYEHYTLLGSTKNTTFSIILHAANCAIGDVLTIDFRPGIAAGATSINFNTSNPWTTSKVLVFPE